MDGEVVVIIGVLIAALFIIDGLRRIFSFVLFAIQWKKSQEWHATSGKIIRADLQGVLVPRGGRKGYNIDGSVRSVKSYIPDIVYQYRANAESIQSKQIYIGQNFPAPLNFANDLVDKYPEGREVTVYYNPEKPNIAILERDRFKEPFRYLARGVFSLLIGFLILIESV